MIIVQLTYKVSLQEVENYVQAHRDFLEYYYQQGLLIVSGPLKPRTGGIIIAATHDKEYVQSLFKQDPYYLAEVADYQFLEFIPIKYRDELKPLIQRMEGNAC